MSARLAIESPSCPKELRRQHWSASDFEVEETVYAAKASQVHKVKCLRTGASLALKLYWKGCLSARNHEQVRREARIHFDLDHRHIISLYAAFEDNLAYYFVLEWAEKGDVFTHQCGRRFPERPAVKHLVEPVLQALAYMHNKGILHRDIKPENLLIAKEGGDEVVKIADFGLCIDSLEERPTSRVGTVEYMAPEVAVRTSRNGDGSPGNPRRPYGVSADVWSVGVLIHELLTGVTPSDVAQPGGGSKAPVSTEGMSRPEYVSESAWDLISSCLRNAACDRPSVSQLLRHPLITGEAFVPARSKIGSVNLAQSDVSFSLSPKPHMKHRPCAARLAVTGTEDGDCGSASLNKTKGICMRVGRQSLSKYSGDEQELASMIMRKMQVQDAASAEEQLKPAQHQAVQRRGSWVAAKPSAKAIERENRRRSCLMPRNMMVAKDIEETAAIVMEPGRRRGFGPRDETSTGELLPSRPTTPKSLRQWSLNNSSSSSDLYDEALERGFAAAESADLALLSPSQKPKLPPLKLPPSPVARTSSPHSPGTPSKRLPASLTQLADDRSSSPSLLRRPKMLDSAFRYPELPTTRKELF